MGYCFGGLPISHRTHELALACEADLRLQYIIDLLALQGHQHDEITRASNYLAIPYSQVRRIVSGSDLTFFDQATDTLDLESQKKSMPTSREAASQAYLIMGTNSEAFL